MKKNAFFQSPIMCTSNDAVVDQQSQLEILQKRSFESSNCSSSSPNTSPFSSSQRKYVAPLELKQTMEQGALHTMHQDTEAKKSRTAVDLDEDVSTDSSASKPHKSIGEEGKVVSEVVSPSPQQDPTIDLSTSLMMWSQINQHIEEAFGPIVTTTTPEIHDDDRTEGSDNSKCSFGFEKPLSMKKKKKHPIAEKEVSEMVRPVLDKTPSKVEKKVGEDIEDVTCAWSESETSTIPTVIYIRRDVPPVVPDDEALGQNYDAKQLRAIHNYTNRMTHTTDNDEAAVNSSYLMKGLRILSLGVIGTKKASTVSQVKVSKIHLDDDASEAFQQTLIDI